MLAFVTERSQTIKHHLAGRTRFQLRTVPSLSFTLMIRLTISNISINF